MKIAKNKVLSGFGDGIGKETGIFRQKTKGCFCLVREAKSEQPGVGELKKPEASLKKFGKTESPA